MSKKTKLRGVSVYSAAADSGGPDFILSAVRLDLRVPRLYAAQAHFLRDLCGAEMVRVHRVQPGAAGGRGAGAGEHLCHERHLPGVLLVPDGVRGVSQRDPLQALPEIRPDGHHPAELHQLGAGVLRGLQRAELHRGGQYGADGPGPDRQAHRLPQLQGPHLVQDVAVADLEERRLGGDHVPGGHQRHRRADDRGGQGGRGDPDADHLADHDPLPAADLLRHRHAEPGELPVQRHGAVLRLPEQLQQEVHRGAGSVRVQHRHHQGGATTRCPQPSACSRAS